MAIRLSIRVHQHYIRSEIRFWYSSERYVQYGFSRKDFPRIAFLQSDANALFSICQSEIGNTQKDDDFPTFPYPAYLSVVIDFPNASDHTDFTVVEAKYSETQRGLVDLTGAFTGKFITGELKRKVMANLLALVASRDESGLFKVINSLRTASGGKYVKSV